MSNEAPVLAMVAGKPLTEMPTDLFIPPNALEVLLDSFTGPLDLLLYLIRQQNIDILDIPIAMITDQYMHYIDLLEAHRIELAADYLVMAAVLAEIKSKLLLPPSPSDEVVEVDPRLELVRRLQLYEQFKEASLLVDQLPRFDRDVFQVKIKVSGEVAKKVEPEVCLTALIETMMRLMEQQQHVVHHQISREVLSVRERMTLILSRLQETPLLEWTQLLLRDEGRMGLVVTFLASLELARQSLVILIQRAAYAPIHLQGSLNKDE